jgi:hypothetical protein
MLTIICGEDVVASREFLYSTLEAAKKKGIEVTGIRADDLATLVDQPVVGLFSTETIYTIENLNRSIARKGSKHTIETLQKIANSKTIHLYDWENFISSRELKIAKVGIVKEFKPANNIFQLLDACYPGNAKTFLTVMHNITDVKNEMFVYLMLLRHVRTVFLTKVTGLPHTTNPWQKSKLSAVARQWDGARLTDFYGRLLAIDTSLKTGKNVYGVQRSLDILACYYL